MAAAAWLLISAVETFAVHESDIARRPQDYRPQTLFVMQFGAHWSA